MASLVASAVHGADISGQTTARTVTGLANEVVQYANNVRVNEKAALGLSRRVADMAAALASLSVETAAVMGEDGPLLPVLSAFEHALMDAQQTLQALGQRSYLSQLVHQQRDRERLIALSETVDNEFQCLMVQLRLHMSSMAVDLSSNMEALAAKHRAEFEVLRREARHEHVDHVDAVATARIPPKPHLFFGRASETQAVVDAVTAPAAGRVAILGGPGMGKTTLALAVLHDPAVARRYGARRFFVPCDAAEGHASCLSTVCEALGIVASESNPKAARQKLHALLGAAPAMLVLDNFESAWEPAAQRAQAEQMLQYLDAIEGLALVVTMRGADRPSGVRWARPFLAPLSPLSDAAAQQTFVAIADVADSAPEAAVVALLAYLDNIPLAVVLMANLAQWESPANLVRRWDEAATASLVRGDGRHRLNSLDASIMLSLRSPRMLASPRAQSLLSLLALLPQGIFDVDIGLWNLSHSRQALAVLLQTSLAVRSADHRVYVLAPIRSFMQTHHPPPVADAAPLYRHFFSMAELAMTATPFMFNESVFSATAAELANIESVARYALRVQDGENLLREALAAVVRLCEFFSLTGVGSAPELLPVALAAARDANLDDLCADLLYHWGSLTASFSMAGDARGLLRQAQEIYQRIGHAKGSIQTSTYLARFVPPADAMVEVHRQLELATSLDDGMLMAFCTRELAIAYERAQRPTEAIELLERAISISRQGTPSPRTARLAGLCLFQIAELRRRAGDLVSAVRLCEQALPIFKEAFYVTGINIILRQLANMLLYQGEPYRALQYASEAIALQHTTDATHYIRSLLVHARASATMGNTDDAAADIEKAAKILREGTLEDATQSEIFAARGFLAQWCGNTEEARALFAAARGFARGKDAIRPREGMLTLEAASLSGLSKVEASDGNPEEALTLGFCAVAIYRKMTGPLDLVRGLALMTEAMDDELAEQVIRAILLPLKRLGHAHGLAIVLLRSAIIAQRRSQYDLARLRAQNALKYFGDIRDGRRLQQTRDIRN